MECYFSPSEAAHVPRDVQRESNITEKSTGGFCQLEQPGSLNKEMCIVVLLLRSLFSLLRVAQISFSLHLQELVSVRKADGVNLGQGTAGLQAPHWQGDTHLL